MQFTNYATTAVLTSSALKYTESDLRVINIM